MAVVLALPLGSAAAQGIPTNPPTPPPIFPDSTRRPRYPGDTTRADSLQVKKDLVKWNEPDSVMNAAHESRRLRHDALPGQHRRLQYANAPAPFVGRRRRAARADDARVGHHPVQRLVADRHRAHGGQRHHGAARPRRPNVGPGHLGRPRVRHCQSQGHRRPPNDVVHAGESDVVCGRTARRRGRRHHGTRTQHGVRHRRIGDELRSPRSALSLRVQGSQDGQRR